jgi:hypothetical protein
VEHVAIVTGPVVVQTATLTSGSPVVTGLTTPALAGAVLVTGTGIPPGTFVASVDSASQVTLTQHATASGSESLTFTLQPITLAEAKLHLRLEIPDDDSLVAALVAAAALRASAELRQTLLLTTFDWYLDLFPSGGGGYFNRQIRQQGLNPQWLPNGQAILYVPNPPLVSVTSVNYYDSTGNLATVDPTSYWVSTGIGSRIQPLIGRVWPVVRPQIDGVVVRYTSGVANASLVPDNVKAAMKLMIGHWYEHREEVADFQLMTVPNAVDALLSATDHGAYS